MAKKEKTAVKPTDPVLKAEQNASDELNVFPKVEKVNADITDAFDKEAKQLFKAHPGSNAFHFAADGLAFYEISDARNHSKTLSDKQVITKTR